ncbi:class I SAM-dependent methyltransferase [candidate division FCPU426 bacterium]|nr:class I SAM-dependent methyltransferase [candidate division FCPU426 bacterium]
MPSTEAKEKKNGGERQNAYYLEYNAKSLSFPRNLFHAPKLKAAGRLAAALPAGARVLDAGCGSGYVSNGLASRLELVGVDIEEEAVAFCRQHRQGTFIRADLQKLPFDPDTFDLILFTNTIEHLYDPHPVLAELARILKPGGKLLVSTENCANVGWILLEQTWYRFFGGPCKPYLSAVHPQRYTAGLLQAHLDSHFTVEQIDKAVGGMELIAVACKTKMTGQKHGKIPDGG